jgi:hypothetical protein
VVVRYHRGGRDNLPVTGRCAGGLVEAGVITRPTREFGVCVPVATVAVVGAAVVVEHFAVVARFNHTTVRRGDNRTGGVRAEILVDVDRREHLTVDWFDTEGGAGTADMLTLDVAVCVVGTLAAADLGVDVVGLAGPRDDHHDSLVGTLDRRSVERDDRQRFGERALGAWFDVDTFTSFGVFVRHGL